MTPTSSLNLEQLSTLFVNHALQAPRTRAAYEDALQAFLGYLRRNSVNALTTESVRGYLQDCAKEKAPSTVRLHLAAIRSFCKFLNREQVLSNDPTDGLQPPTRITKQIESRPLSDGDLRKLLENLQGNSNIEKRNHTLVLFLTYTGAKIQEVAFLKLQDLSLESEPPSVRLRSRGGHSRELCIPESLRTALRELITVMREQDPQLQDSSPVFQTVTDRGLHFSGRPFRSENLSAAVNNLAKAAGLPGDVTPSSFRARFAVTLFRHGVSAVQLRDLLGLNNLASVYAYLSSERPHISRVPLEVLDPWRKRS